MKEPILRNFLGAENCEESDKQPSVVIKSYLKFCAVTESDVWQPTILEQWDQTFESEYYDETEDEISENEKLSDEWEDDVDNTPEVVDNDRKSRKKTETYIQLSSFNCLRKRVYAGLCHEYCHILKLKVIKRKLFGISLNKPYSSKRPAKLFFCGQL